MSTQPRIVNVTPATAAKWLEKNTFNRKLKPQAVATLLGAIRRGEWVVGNDAICFAPDGSLLNGQHRLTAIKESGETLPVLIREGVPKAEQLAMDQGRKRQAYEQMDIIGISGGSAKQGLCRAILLYDEQNGPVGRLEGITNAEIIELARGDEVMDQALFLQQQLGRSIKNARVVMVALGYYLLLHAWPERVETFHELLYTGANLTPNSPVLKLRNLLLANDVPQHNSANRRKLLALFLKAFNMWVDNQEREILTWRAYDEAWPAPYTKSSYARMLAARERAAKGHQTRQLKKVAG